MNSYPPELIVQLAPLMFVAGLDNTQDQFIQRLRTVLLSQRKQAIYQPGSTAATTFHVQLVDKSLLFPPRKLASTHGHYSPLSPLSPSSPLYPDGIIAPIWVRKHTTLLPCVFVLFLPLSEDNVDADAEKEQDSALCTIISSRKRLTSERNMKLTVVLLASRRLLDHPSLEPRLTFMRRQSGLDARASLFVLSPVGNRELTEFVNSLQTALADSAAEYYAAHGRRVRRKRNKHSQPSQPPPPPPPMAQSIPIPRPLRPEGWSIRYSYKLAAFAEFRGEFEVALKHYQEAYSSLCLLFSSPGSLPPSSTSSSTLLSSTSPSTSSLAPLAPRTKRWAEAKVLSDCINIKIVKLFLYNNEHSLACAQHHSHIGLFSDMSERLWGIGESTFEFWSWVGRQYRVLAELIDQGQRSNLVLPSHSYRPSKPLITNSTDNNPDFDPLSQKSQSLSGLNPAHALLHSGYYYYAAARCAEMRRKRFLSTLQAEAENKVIAILSPGFANEKKVDHLGLIVELYTKAYEVFKSTVPPASAPTTQGKGSRQTLWIAYRIAESYRAGGKYDLAVRFFDRIARTYRHELEGWNELLRGVLEGWFECIVALGGVGDGVGVEEGVKVLLELIALGGSERGVDDLMGLLKTTKPSKPDKPLVVELVDSSFTLFETSTTFYTPTVKISELAAFQVRMTSSDCVWNEWEGGGGIGRVEIWINVESGEKVVDACVTVLHMHRQKDDEDEREEGDDQEEGKRKKTVRKIELGEVGLNLGSGSGSSLVERGENVDERRIIKEVEANLEWKTGETVVFCGFMRCQCVGVVEVSKIIVIFEEPQNGWVVEVPIPISNPRTGVILPVTGSGQHLRVDCWLSSVDPPRFVPLREQGQGHGNLTIKRREHLIDVSFSHHAPAYVDEEYVVDVEVMNVDERPLDVTIGFLVRPGEDEWVVNWIIVDGERSTSLIKGVGLGVVQPGGRVRKRIIVICSGVKGERVVDVEVLTRIVESEKETMEHLEMLVVNAIEPFKADYEVLYSHASTGVGWAGLADLRTFDGSWWDVRGRGAGEVLVCGRVAVGSGEDGSGRQERVIVVEKVELERMDGRRARILESDVDVGDGDVVFYPDEFIEGDEFCVNCRIILCVDDEGDDLEDEIIEGPGKYCVLWHRILPDGTHGPSVKTRFDLPTLRSFGVNDGHTTTNVHEVDDGDQTTIDDESNSKGIATNTLKDNGNTKGLVALLQVPAVGRLHKAMRVELVVRNQSLVRSANVDVSVVGMISGQSTSGESGVEGQVDAGGQGFGLQQPQQQQFVVAGIRNGRLGIVLPGEEVRVVWVVVPLECGYLRVPKVRVLDLRDVGGEGENLKEEEVEVIDAGRYYGAVDSGEGKIGGVDVGSVLVLP